MVWESFEGPFAGSGYLRQLESKLARNDISGQVLVDWRDAEDNANLAEIRARLYSPTMTAPGDDFKVNTIQGGHQTWPGVADYGEAGFFVVWESANSAGPDVEPNSIEGRIVTGSDQFTGPQMNPNTHFMIAPFV